MKKYAKFLSLIAAFVLLCGCTKIPDSSSYLPDVSEPENSDSTSKVPVENKYEQSVKEFNILRQDFIAKLNAEGGVYDGTLIEDDRYDGKGYVKLKEGNTLTHILNANTPQHYRIILAARSETGAAVSLEVGGKTCDAFYIPAGVPEENENSKELPFEYSAVDCVYLSSGQNVLKFHIESGSVDIDYIIVESSGTVDPKYFEVGSACASPFASLRTVHVMKYLSEIYGRSVLTAQNVSPATNAEINAVYNATGRYPAIRSSEIAYAMSEEEEDAERLKKETELALEWLKDGGLQSYTWHWYSPNYKHGTALDDFNISGIFDSQLPGEVAMMNDSEIKVLVENGYMPTELAALLGDIDRMAAILKLYDSENLTLLFHPIPDGDTGTYWWGKSPESYKTLWQIMFDRMCRYHKLRCLIWVWDGSNMDYYPGDDYVDIIGQSFYESTDASFAGRMSSIASITPTTKILGISACDVIPSIDHMHRDNAMWIWAAAESGDYTLNMNGALSESYNSVPTMKYFYNNEYTVALDELPDFDKVI